jgi:hypothetical protein
MRQFCMSGSVGGPGAFKARAYPTFPDPAALEGDSGLVEARSYRGRDEMVMRYFCTAPPARVRVSGRLRALGQSVQGSRQT